MLTVFKEVKEKRFELEKLKMLAQANAVTYRQKGETHTADRFQALSETLDKVVNILKEANPG